MFFCNVQSSPTQFNKIFVIYTGGTIGMVNDANGMLIPFNFDQIKDNVPELSRLNYHLDVHSFDPVLDSSHMHPEIWHLQHLHLALC